MNGFPRTIAASLLPVNLYPVDVIAQRAITTNHQFSAFLPRLFVLPWAVTTLRLRTTKTNQQRTSWSLASWW